METLLGKGGQTGIDGRVNFYNLAIVVLNEK
jgi:hypothetical protein